MHWRHRHQPPPAQVIHVHRIELIFPETELFMALIADQTAAIAALTTAVDAAVTALTNVTPPSDATHLSAEDQAAVDANVTATVALVQKLTDALASVAPTAPAEPAPTDGGDVSDGTSDDIPFRN